MTQRTSRLLAEPMRNFMTIAIFALIVAAIVPRLAATAVGTHGAPNAPNAIKAQTATTATTASSAYGRTFTVRADNRGHFQVEGRIDGRRLDFLVDTGATKIVISEREAARVGIHPARRDYTGVSQTANGTGRYAPTQLNMVEVGGLIVYNVAAAIVPDEALGGGNLLGMSFLTRLRRFEIAEGRLVLEQ